MSAPLLFLSAHLPVECSRQAGHKTAWRHLSWLAEHYAVHLIAFRSEGDRDEPLAALRKVCAHVEVVDVTRALRFQGLLRHPNWPLAVVARYCPSVRHMLREWCRQIPFTRVHLEWSQMAQYLDVLATVPVRALYIQDVLAQWAERKGAQRRSWLWRWEAQRTRKWEQRVYQRCTQLYVPSGKDAELIARDSPELRSRIKVLPLHFDVYGSAEPRRQGGPLRLLFWGALGRRENADGARWLCHHLVPRLRADRLPFVLVLAGSNPPRDLEELRASDVEITGFLEDPMQQFDRAHLAVAPLFEGAGVKVKVLECLASGLPVLTTAIGSEGIEAHPEEGLITLAGTPEAFATVIAALDADRSKLAYLSAAAAAWGKSNSQDYRSVLLG